MDKKLINRRHQQWFGYGVFAVIFVMIIVLRFTCGAVIAVSGTSMVPTFDNGDFVVGRVMYDNTELDVGDIVILQQDDKYLIKRVYGTPGTTIRPDYVKGIPAITLGNDEYYVLGDNWKDSRDSRTFGPVDRDAIRFKYAGIHWNKLSLIICLIIPTVLFLVQMSIVFMPADEPKKAKRKRDEIPVDDETPENGVIVDDAEKETVASDDANACDTTPEPTTEEIQCEERSAS